MVIEVIIDLSFQKLGKVRVALRRKRFGEYFGQISFGLIEKWRRGDPVEDLKMKFN